MNEFFTKITAFLTAMLLTFTGLFANWNKNPKVAMDALAKTGVVSSDKGDSYTITSKDPVTVNTMTLVESGNKVKSFTLEALTDDGYQLVTKGDTIGSYRYCKFDDVTASEFRVTITNYDSSFKITSTKLGHIETENSDFKVFSYWVADGLNENYKIDEKRFLSTTDLIVFSVATFNENGEITLRNMDVVSKLLVKIKEINPAIRVHLNLLGSPNNKELHIGAMKDNREKFISNIVSTLNEYDFDGVFFDWEFPETLSLKAMFSSFLIDLDYALGERQLGIAVAAWCSNFSLMAIHAVDNVEVMAYDLFDNFGYHATFGSCYDSVNQMLRNGYSAKQLHLGLAYYARPTDRGEYWFDWNSYSNTLGYYDTVCDVNYDGKVMESYFNSPQLIRDKTAYALDRGLGGVMMWHFGCDTDYSNDLSLFKALNLALSKDI